MNLTAWKHPVTGERTFTLTISDAEMYTAFDRFTRSERMEAMPFFDRPDASIEERLMGLQIITRHIEEAHEEET